MPLPSDPAQDGATANEPRASAPDGTIIVTFTQSRWPCVLFAVFGLLFLPSAGPMFVAAMFHRSVTTQIMMGLLSLITVPTTVFLLCRGFGGLVRPATIEIGPEGVRLKDALNNRIWNWDAISNFRPYSNPSNRDVGVKFDVSPPGGGPPVLAYINLALWSVATSDVVAKLKAAKLEYTGAKDAPSLVEAKPSAHHGRVVMMWCVLPPAVMAGLFATGISKMVSDARADRLSQPYVRGATYLAAPGCPMSAAGMTSITSLPPQCDDPHHRIRSTNSLPDYHLPYFKNEDHWLRIGPDAVTVSGCDDRLGASDCEVDYVVRNTFPCCAKQGPLVALKRR
jgi:hypothetical protein